MERVVVPETERELTLLPSLVETLSERFARWEKRGRGWQVWNDPVDIEPPFVPFYHGVPDTLVTDDARHPSQAPRTLAIFSLILSVLAFLLLLSSFQTEILTFAIVSLIWPVLYFSQGRTAREPLPSEESVDENIHDDPLPNLAERDPDDLCFLHLLLPPGAEIGKEASERLLLALKYVSAPVSFEIVGTHREILFQLSCHKDDKDHLFSQLQAYFPHVYCLEAVDGLGAALKDLVENNEGQTEGIIVDFGLNDAFMQPLNSSRDFRSDPLIPFVGALSNLNTEETGVVQILFKPVKADWMGSIRRSVIDWEGKPFFMDAPEMTKMAGQKIAHPLFAAVIRMGGFAEDKDQAFEIVRCLGAGLEQFALAQSNSFIPLSNEGYGFDAHLEDLLLRQSRRSGMLLNSQELVSCVHLPSVSIKTEKLARWRKKSKTAPEITVGNELVLGENIHGGMEKVVSLSAKQRMQHTYVIGASGTGKSTLLLNMIVQDIEQGHGVGVLDPHGDLIDKILPYIPKERIDDVVLFDPSDEAYPVGFNILSAHSELEKNLLSSDLVSVFRRLSTSWGDQMTSVLGNAILAFLESKEGGTLSDLRRFLVETDYRRRFLLSVQDPEVVYYWEKEYPIISGKPQGPLLTRLDTFLRLKLIRYIVSQKENRLDFSAIMNGKKIFLAKLSQGAIGEENSYLLGTLLVSKLHQLAMSRQELKESERNDFYLYIDEFHNFITPSMAATLSGTRKYHLGLILAHQEMQQLWSRDTEVASAVISNPYTRICFRLGDFDAQKLKEGFSDFDAKDLQNLGTGEAICRVERAEYDFTLKTVPLPEVESDLAEKRRAQVIASSRKKYALPREVVEEQLKRERPKTAPHPVVEKEVTQRETAKPETREALPPPIFEEEEKPSKTRKSTSPKIPVTPGRGGGQHKYLQQLILRLAQDKGYRATIEKQVLDGVGSIDVTLEKADMKIACEISVTSTDEQEFKNIQKCLAAGYDPVILLSSDRKAVKKMKAFISEKLEPENRDKILFLVPDEFVAFLEETDAQAAGTVETVRGYKVKVQYQAVDEVEKKTRRNAIAQVISQAMKRLKGGGRNFKE